MTTIERLERVEVELGRAKRQVHRLWFGIGLTLVVFAVILAFSGLRGIAYAADEKGEKIVRANKFILEDAGGKTRGGWEISDGEPSFILLNEKGKSLVSIRASNDGSTMTLAGQVGMPSVFLVVNKEVTGMTVFDEKTRNRVVVSLSKLGPMLTILDENGKTVWSAPK